MSSVDKIRNSLIDKILSIKNEEFLTALEKLIVSSSTESEIIELSEDQKSILKLSEEDVEYGRLISQEEMLKRNFMWLNESTKSY